MIDIREERLGLILLLVRDEVRRAMKRHAPLNSPHEGYAVLKEEVDELWSEVKCDRGRMNEASTEALQVAAMAVRYVLDLGYIKGTPELYSRESGGS